MDRFTLAIIFIDDEHRNVLKTPLKAWLGLMNTHLPAERHFYWHRDDLRQQAAIKSRHESTRVVVWEDQRHLKRKLKYALILNLIEGFHFSSEEKERGKTVSVGLSGSYQKYKKAEWNLCICYLSSLSVFVLCINILQAVVIPF